MTSTTLQLSEPFGRLACRDIGRGEPLVLIHGVGMQSAAWTPQIEAFASGYRVLALDLPGHGASDRMLGAPEVPDYVDWLQAALNALDLGQVNIAGHSMGALIAAGYAITHPERVDRVALLNGVYRRSDEARAAVAARADQILQGDFDLETPLDRWFGQMAHDLEAREKVSGWLSSVEIRGYASAYAAFAKGDATYADRFQQISCPLLALTGDGDANSTPDMARAMAEAAPQGAAVVIEGHRHMVNMTAPQQVNAALANWLESPLQHEETA